MRASTRQAAMPNTRKKMAEIQAIAPFMKPIPSLAFLDALRAATQSSGLDWISSRLDYTMPFTQLDGCLFQYFQGKQCSSAILNICDILKFEEYILSAM